MGKPDLTGPDIENREEVRDVKRALGKIGIFLEGYGISITGVYVRPRPYGFDFDCAEPEKLLATARKTTSLSEDKLNTREGSFSAGQTVGTGLRQIGTGPRLHLEIALSGKNCNAHIDSHGYVIGQGLYDWNIALEHGYWDLAADKAPGLFGAFGDRGQVGPMIRPMVGVDGQTRWVWGVTGHW
jgi:hypothetical protein